MNRRHSLCRDDAISKYGNVPFLPGSLCFFPPTSLEPSKLALSLQLGPLRRPILRPIEANPANPSPPPKRRETRNFARDFDFVRSSKSVVESLEASLAARPSTIIVHRSWYTFSRVGGGDKRRKIMRSFKGFSRRSLVVAGYRAIERGNDRRSIVARDWMPSFDAVSIFLDCLFSFFSFLP